MAFLFWSWKDSKKGEKQSHLHGVHHDNLERNPSSTTATSSVHGTVISSRLSRDENSMSRCWTSITQSNISFLRKREPPGPQECFMESTELFTSLSKLWRIFKKLCPCLRDLSSSYLTTQPKSKSHWCQKRFVYLRRREEPLRPPVYWPCIISVHQESWLQRWTLLRTVLWMGSIKGIIRVRCVETSMLHLTVSIKGVTVFSVTSVYLKNATTPPP